MKPLHPRYFGPEEGRLKIRFHNGVSVTEGYILKQIGTNRYIVSDGSGQFVVKLAQTTQEAVSLVPGMATILLDGANGFAKSVHSRKLVTTEGEIVNWSEGSTNISRITRTLVSGSVRAAPIISQGGTITATMVKAYRWSDRSSAQCVNPRVYYSDGRILSGGVTGQSIEVVLPTTTAPRKYKAAILTGVSGTSKNQSSATLVPATFFDMESVDGFAAAGGSVSADGYTITVPSGWVFWTDKFTGMTLLGTYMHQVEVEVAAAGDSTPAGTVGVSGLGDLYWSGAAGTSLAHSTDWTAAGTFTSGGLNPVMVLGDNPTNKKTWGIWGDSIISRTVQTGAGVDVGNSYGALNFAKRALSEADIPYIDLSVPGTNIGNFMAGYDREGIRASWLQYCSGGVISDMGHNDRRSGITFESSGTWSESALTNWNTTGLRVRYEWMVSWLRTKLPFGAKVIQTTLDPQTNSTDTWLTTANQTGKNDDSTWASDYATNSTNGDQFKLNDLIMLRGLYSDLSPGGSLADAGFDLYESAGTADGKYIVDGSTANYATADGTHRSQALQILAANSLAERLSDLGLL